MYEILDCISPIPLGFEILRTSRTTLHQSPICQRASIDLTLLYWSQIRESVATANLRKVAANVGESITGDVGVIHRLRLDRLERWVELTAIGSQTIASVSRVVMLVPDVAMEETDATKEQRRRRTYTVGSFRVCVTRVL